MNRRIAAWTIATVAVLGLTACSGAPAAEDASKDSDKADDSAAVEETNTDQSVEDACGIVIPEMTEASSAMNDVDAAAADPQATVDQFNEVVTALGETADKVTNPEVKDATTAVYDDFVKLADILEKVVVDQDVSASEDLGTISSDMMESATALQELCS
ncbi:MAG TPA: hypothetical protein DIW46_10540 [Microbacterium sp.]|uniref:hypothetical protein n=1 Tax=Microbacterium sp. TaxID=51671 RepID=UPI000EEF6955|nr:hypothetical protein [Microbacterium sp.]